MNNRICLFLMLAFSFSCTRGRNTSVPTIYSENVRDSFELYVDLPPCYTQSDSNYSVTFYMDANLKMGHEIRRQIKLEENKTSVEKVIFVGIGHIGPYRKLRRRDFIPPVIKEGVIQESKDPDFGHADKFYAFLTKELIPYINHNYPNNGKYTYIGHSFSGLFAFYSLIQSPQAFTNYVALSPSLWTNYNNFFEHELNYLKTSTVIHANLYHACGTGEWTNKVLATSRQMNQLLKNERYQGFNYAYVEHPGKNHNGVVPVSLEYVIKNMLTQPIQKDSIKVESSVTFKTVTENIYRFSENDPYLYNMISFDLKVTNKSKKNIPDLNSTNQSKYVVFLINGKKEDKLMYSIDESVSADPKDWVIKPGESDSFTSGWYFDLEEKYGLIYFYGTEFTVQWEYMGIKSETYKVNMKTKTSELVQY